MTVFDAKLASAKASNQTTTQDGAAFRVVAIGASSGGLDACTQLLRALPAHTGMAFILVQHLDPDHDSLLAGCLRRRRRSRCARRPRA